MSNTYGVYVNNSEKPTAMAEAIVRVFVAARKNRIGDEAIERAMSALANAAASPALNNVHVDMGKHD